MTRSSEVVVIGGGVIGASVAYFAARRGLDVILIDRPKRGRATSASAGGSGRSANPSGSGAE